LPESKLRVFDPLPVVSSSCGTDRGDDADAGPTRQRRPAARDVAPLREIV